MRFALANRFNQLNQWPASGPRPQEAFQCLITPYWKVVPPSEEAQASLLEDETIWNGNELPPHLLLPKPAFLSMSVPWNHLEDLLKQIAGSHS